MKVDWETNKIFGINPETPLPMACTAVRIAALRAHSESIHVETTKEIQPEYFREILEGTRGVEVVDDPSNNIYPMQITSSNRDDVAVGRIRYCNAFEKGLSFYVCGDQIRKGAALNAVQIAEVVYSERFL